MTDRGMPWVYSAVNMHVWMQLPVSCNATTVLVNDLYQ